MLSLIPERTGDRKRSEGRKHSFVKHGGHHGPILEPNGHQVGWTRIDTQPTLPIARQRDACFISESEMQLVGLAEKSALRFGLEDTNRNDIFSGLQYAIRDEVGTRVLDPGAGSDFDAIDVGGIHALDRPQEQGSAPYACPARSTR